MAPEEENPRHIYHRSIEPNEEAANVELVSLVADVEGCEVEDLPPFWTRIDGLVKDVFTDPPAPEAQVRIQFSYAGYRIHVDQSGDVELMKVGEEPTTDG